MRDFALSFPAGGSPRLEVPYRGVDLLREPLFTKGTAFTMEERAVFQLEGLLPDAVSSLQLQSRRVYANIRRKTDPLEKFIGLAALQERNEHLFYRLLIDHIEEFLPIVYTPTVGRACQEFSHIFRRGRGLWITPGQRGRIHEVLQSAPFSDVRLIVVTDNERILGLGDQGAGGMGIPIGKLALYSAAAGIHPAQTLPISLDVGTDNADLLADELYLGWRHGRLRGAEYDALVEEFVQAVKRCFPRALLQWEDFKKGNAFRLLDRYRKALPSFNDDIQGTAAVAVAAIAAGARSSGTPLREQRVVILGAGAAGVGIARLVRSTLQRAGLSGPELTCATANLDRHGLLVDDEPIAEDYKRAGAWPAELAERHGLGRGRPRDLASVVKALRPTVLIGTSGQPGTFDQALVRSMAAGVSRPVILPLSNPTDRSEATPRDILNWSDGRALVATGSPFDPVQHDGRTIHVGQANNAFVFPGIGLGVLVAEAREVTDGMFAAAAECLAGEIHADDLQAGRLFPPIKRIRSVTEAVARAVVREAREEGVGRALADADIPGEVARHMWDAQYPELVPV